MNTVDRDNEIRKYVEAYQSPNYRMGDARFQEATEAIRYADVHRETLLDVGTGRGEILHWALRHGEFDSVEGTEVVPYLCGELNNDLGKISVKRAMSIDLPYEDDSFELVTCFDVLEHLIGPDLQPTLEELRRVAGRCVIVTANDKPSSMNGTNYHITRMSYDAWDKIIGSVFEDRIRTPGFSEIWTCYI